MDFKALLGDMHTEEIEKQLTAAIAAEYVAKADHDALAESNKQLTSQVSDRDGQLEALKKLKPEELQAQIDKLTADNKAAAENHIAELAAAKLESAVETRLIKEGAVNTRAVKALLDSSKLAFGEDGSLSGLDEQIAALKTSDAWAFTAAGVPGFGGNPAGGQQTPPAVPQEAAIKDAFQQK